MCLSLQCAKTICLVFLIPLSAPVFNRQDGVGGLLSLLHDCVHLLRKPKLYRRRPHLPVEMHGLRRQLGGREICGRQRV